MQTYKMEEEDFSLKYIPSDVQEQLDVVVSKYGRMPADVRDGIRRLVTSEEKLEEAKIRLEEEAIDCLEHQEAVYRLRYELTYMSSDSLRLMLENLMLRASARWKISKDKVAEMEKEVELLRKRAEMARRGMRFILKRM